MPMKVKEYIHLKNTLPNFNEILIFSIIICGVLCIFGYHIICQLFNMASQHSNRNPTMRIPKDILPQLDSLKNSLDKESRSDVLRWVFTMYAPHIQAVLKSTTSISTSSSGASNQGGQMVIDLSQDSKVPAFFQSLGTML
jgi:predicted PurR-regulated permease PerM